MLCLLLRSAQSPTASMLQRPKANFASASTAYNEMGPTLAVTVLITPDFTGVAVTCSTPSAPECICAGGAPPSAACRT